MYKISMIIPVYNVELYLKKCLDTIISQYSGEIEIICVEDCSEDASKDILLCYKKNYPYITVICHDKNKGLSEARNTGIQYAHGEYVMFVDSDDYLRPNALKNILAYLQDPDIDILTFNYDVSIENDLFKEKKIEYSSNNYAYNEFVNGIQWLKDKKSMDVTVWSKIYRRNFLIDNKISFVRNILHEDIPFFFEVFSKAQKIIDITSKCYCYRKRDNAITSSKSAKHLESYITIFRILSHMKYLNIELDKTKEFSELISSYLDNCIAVKIENLMYFFDIDRMSSGTLEDQIILDVFKRQLINKNQWIQLSLENMARIDAAKEIFIYGAGMVAIELMRNLERLDIKISAFIVSNTANNPDNIKNYRIISLDSFGKDNHHDYLVLVAVRFKFYREIIGKLEENNIKNYLYVVDDIV